jgi:lipoate-protein ligase A
VTRVVACRLIVDGPIPGPRNMATDEVLLIDAAENGVATLRFYQWSEPTLSLGYFQRHDDRYSHQASTNCAIVRRQTGGGAILHDRELTYSLCLPAAHPLARQSEQLYTAVHEAFIAELQPRLAAADSPWKLFRSADPSTGTVGKERFLCFQRRARGDVLLAGDDTCRTCRVGADIPSATVKILGSAQRRHRGAILQHGSLLLERSPLAPELAGFCDMTGVLVPPGELIQQLAGRLFPAMTTTHQESTFSGMRESKVDELTNKKYGSGAWTKRR